ncbi:MAG: glutamate 5-kinase [Planctomycetota bacterium]
MPDLLRQDVIAAADTVVVKIGTRVLTGPDGALDHARVEAIAGQLAAAWKSGRKVVLVSSGAVGAGLGRLQANQRPADVAQLQAAAAIGQSALIESYNRALEPHGLLAAQVLLIAEDLQDRRRYLNVRNTLSALFQSDAIPIINENDALSVEELQLSFGDNDRLAALVTNLIRAPLLVLLSDVDGVYDRDPKEPGAKVLPVITNLGQTQDRVVSERPAVPGVSLGKGGMASKLQAASIAAAAGESVVIANGHADNVLDQVLAAEPVGTLILAEEGKAVGSRKRWIGWSASPQGELQLDAGAQRAVADRGGSLLAVGVTGVQGDFVKGDLVSLVGPAGNEFARGLTNYTSAEVRQIAGHPATDIAELLGHHPYDEVIHRDNLTVTAQPVATESP